MKIGNRKLRVGSKPYIVAEISGEHRQKWDDMVKLMTAAKEAGADAIKIQVFDPVQLAKDRGGTDKVCISGPWKGITLGQLYMETYTPYDWHKSIIQFSKDTGIDWFASVFDVPTVDYLMSLDCRVFKIASQEHMYRDLIHKVAKTNRPMIVSLPCAELAIAQKVGAIANYFRRIENIVEAVPNRYDNLAFLHCTNLYPCPFEYSVAYALRNYLFLNPGIAMGLSDHTLGMTLPIIAATCGAPIIEKHITLSKTEGGWDRSFALEPHEFKQMVKEVHNAWVAMGYDREEENK